MTRSTPNWREKHLFCRTGVLCPHRNEVARMSETILMGAGREIRRQRSPISPLGIANVTGLDLGKVSIILSDLERNLFFLVRDPNGNVSWAFPVTTSVTPHKLKFSTGDNIFGA